MNEEQDVVGGETSPGKHFDCEEDGKCQDSHVGAMKSFQVVFWLREFAGNEPPVPGEDGIGFGDTDDLLKRSPAKSLTNFSEGRSLGIRNADTGGKVGSENPILGCEVFILE